jgi:plasmid stabilization system protein ParE
MAEVWKGFRCAMNHILNNPRTGHKRKDIPKGYLAWPVREHVMIYRIDAPIIYLIRVLYKKMDFRFQFD